MSGKLHVPAALPLGILDMFVIIVLDECSTSYSEAYATNPACYAVGAGKSFLEIKRSRCEADRLPPTSAEVKKTCYTCTPPYVFMVYCIVN
jgi:hypothetical protein